MPELTCAEAKSRLALGHAIPEEVAEHLARCSACRDEAASLSALFRGLAASAEVEPAPIVDEQIRRLLQGAHAGHPGVLRPVTALGLALASTMALATVLAFALAQSGAAEQGVVAAGAVVLTYLALSSTATLPILLYRRIRTTAT
jgi:predicted anti-sigma-YlaC factor YlaD